MEIRFDIVDEKVRNFSPGAILELQAQIKKLSEDIADEASRIEASRRIPDTNSEVTQTYVREAVTQSRIISPKKRNWKNKVIQAVAFISTLIAGGLFDIEKFKETENIVAFLIFSFIATVTTVYLIFNTDHNG